MGSEIDVTKEVECGYPDEEMLPITRCACGAKFEPWLFTISVYDDDPTACPACGRRFYFQSLTKVIEVL